MRLVVEVDGLQWINAGHGDGMGPSHESGEVETAIMSLIRPGSVFLDVGAHVGHYTLRAARIADRVLAVEANPRTAERLRENIALNALDNVTVFEVAAWDTVTTLHLERPNKQDRDGSTRVLPGPGQDQVQACPLDEVLTGLDRLDVIKLDVEGADLHALWGMRGIIAKHRPVMYIEDHSIYGYYNRSDLMALLDAMGYGVSVGGAYGGALYWMCRPREESEQEG